MDQNNEASRRNPVANFLDVMRSLGPSQRRAVAHELAAARYDFAFAMDQPSREQRTAFLDAVLSRAVGTGDGVSKREQLHAIYSLQRHLQDASGPEKRERFLKKIMAQLVRQNPTGPSGALPEHFYTPMDLTHPDGPTQLDLWEACQHQWCYMITTDSYPSWLQPTSDQTIPARRDGRHVCLTSDHPLTILLQWSLTVHNDSAKLRHPHVLKQWHERASSLPIDHDVWRFAHARKEDGIPAEIHGYVPMLPPNHPSGLTQLILKWEIRRETARADIGRLQALSGLGLQELLSHGMLPPSAGSIRPKLTDGEQSDAAEALRLYYLQQRVGVAGRCAAANPDLLQAQPGEYVQQLLHQCGLRDGGRLDGKATGEPHGLASASPRTSEAQQPETSSGLEAQNLRERQAEAVAQSLLLEEEAAKAKAQAQKDAKQQRRRQKSSKASSKQKLLQDPASPRGAFAASSSGQSGEVLFDAEPSMLQAVDQQRTPARPSHPSQGAVSDSDHGRQMSSLSIRAPRLDSARGTSSRQRPASDHHAACHPQQATPQLHLVSSQPALVNDATRSACEPDHQSQAAQQQQGVQQGFKSNANPSSPGAAESAVNIGGDPQSAISAPASAAKPSSISEPQQQEAAVRNDTADTPSSPPWEQTRRSRSRWKDPERLADTGVISHTLRNQGSRQLPEAAQILPSFGQASDARPASGSGRCQPKAKSKSHEASAQVSTGHGVGPGCICL